jgi:hypothetical protein
MTTTVWTDADPGIGDVSELVSLSSRIERIAGIASAARIRLTRLDAQLTGVDWSSASADAFRDRIVHLPTHLSKLTDSYLAATDGIDGIDDYERSSAPPPPPTTSACTTTPAGPTPGPPSPAKPPQSLTVPGPPSKRPGRT